MLWEQGSSQEFAFQRSESATECGGLEQWCTLKNFQKTRPILPFRFECDISGQQCCIHYWVRIICYSEPPRLQHFTHLPTQRWVSGCCVLLRVLRNNRPLCLLSCRARCGAVRQSTTMESVWTRQNAILTVSKLIKWKTSQNCYSLTSTPNIVRMSTVFQQKYNVWSNSD